MKHSSSRHRHRYHHHSDRSQSRGANSSRPLSRAIKGCDSRPLPLQIPGRRSDVRFLIDFYNNRAFRAYDQFTPRKMPDPVPANKVKSLVVDFNRRGPSSFPSTVVSSPTDDTYQWRGPRTRTNSMWTRSEPARGVERPQFGKSLNIKPAARVRENVEEITVSGGDKRETTYRKSQEPFRSVKVWKEEIELKESRAGSVLPVEEREDYHKQHHPREPRARSREPPKERHPNSQRHKPRKAKTPVDGPGLGSEAVEEEEMLYSGDRRKKHKIRGSNIQSDLSSTQGSKTSPAMKQKPKKRGLHSSKPKSPIPEPQRSTVQPHGPDIGQKHASLMPEPQVAPASTYMLQGSLAQAPAAPAQSPKPNTLTGDDTSPTSKRSFTGTLKGSFMSVFGRTREDNFQHKQPTPNERTGSSSGKKKEQLRKFVPGDFNASSQSSVSSEYASISSVPVQDLKPRKPEKFPTITTTEATPIGPTVHGRAAVTREGGEKVKVNQGSAIGKTSSPGYPTSTIRQPRTFKDIALQRREERKKAAEAFATTDNSGRLSVPPLRVFKPQDAGVPKNQPSEPPSQRLYEKASQGTLTSFEDPSIYVSESLSSSESRSPGPVRPVVGLISKKPHSEVQPAATQVPTDATRPPLRSPSMMREMAVPRLTLRIPSSKHSSTKQNRTNRKAQSEIAPPQNSTPRMKLKGDADWMKWSQRRQRTPLMDGFAGVSSSTLELVPRRRRARPRPRAPSSTSSSSSHDTTGSSEIAAKASRSNLNIHVLDTQPETPLSDGDEVGSNMRRDSDYRLTSSMEVKRSKVNFSSTTENFPAVNYPTGEDEKRVFGDRTTVAGAGETGNVGIEEARLNVRGMKKKIQKSGSRGRTRKERKDRPEIVD